MPYEPMFETLQARGYDWESCNVPLAPTQRTRPDGTPPPPFGKIDWLFARGLRCTEPADHRRPSTRRASRSRTTRRSPSRLCLDLNTP